MKLNNKGLSLMELLVSIVLVGIVLVFLFQLLIDLRTETENNDFAFNNQVNKTELVYTIQNDLNKYTLVSVLDGGDDQFIRFVYKKGLEYKVAKLNLYTKTTENILGEEVNKYYFSYESVDGEYTSWEMKNAEVAECGTFVYYFDNLSNRYYFRLVFEVYNSVYHKNNNSDKNNFVDDIEISYTGLKTDLITSRTQLSNLGISDAEYSIVLTNENAWSVPAGRCIR